MDEILNLKSYTMLRQATGDKFDGFLELFYTETKTSLEQLDQAVAAKDYDQINFLSHMLKSTTATVGASSMHAMIVKINNCTFPKDFDLCESIHGKLAASFENLKVEIEKHR